MKAISCILIYSLIEISNKLQSIITDLDTDILFAQSGNYGDLSNEMQSEIINFNSLMTSVVVTARTLTEGVDMHFLLLLIYKF